MPNLASHQSAQTAKMLLLGDQGSGKTGALASLAQAGFNLRVLDLDNGLDVLKNLLLDPKSRYGKEALGRVEFETLTDKMKNSGGKLIPAKATVWQRAVGLLDRWDTESAKLGPISTWTSQDILVIDSLTHLCNAALNFVLSMNARLGQQPHQGDWYAGQQMIESMLQMLYDEGVKCNVIINCHITYIGEENGPQKGYPASLGKALSPKIGSYFNTIMLCRSKGTGAGSKQVIHTRSQGVVECKNTSPMQLEPEYGVEDGLAKIFKIIRAGGLPAPSSVPGVGAPGGLPA